MNWKKTVPYFVWQAWALAENRLHRRAMWSYRRAWTASFVSGRYSVADEQPWVNYEVIDFLGEWLKPEHRVFEFGGGGSTLFFCRRAAFVATVEHDAQWFQHLSDALRKRGLSNWEGHFDPGTELPGQLGKDPSRPEHFRSNGRGYEHLSFESYARTIHRYPESHFDLVLVDGRARPSCIAESLVHIKPAGLLVVDNTERGYYLDKTLRGIEPGFERVLHRFMPTPYTPDFTRTSIWKKR